MDAAVSGHDLEALAVVAETVQTILIASPLKDLADLDSLGAKLGDPTEVLTL